jgi:hypothetical protein
MQVGKRVDEGAVEVEGDRGDGQREIQAFASAARMAPMVAL